MKTYRLQLLCIPTVWHGTRVLGAPTGVYRERGEASRASAAVTKLHSPVPCLGVKEYDPGDYLALNYGEQ